MRSRVGIVAVWAIVGSGALGCESATTAPPPEVVQISEALTIERTPMETRGRFVGAAGTLEFVTTETQAGAALSLTVNGAQLELAVDLAHQRLQIDGHDVILDALDAQTLTAFADELGPWLATHDGRPHEMLAAVNATYWADAPAGYVHRARLVRTDIRPVSDAEADGARPILRSNSDDGIKCIKKGTTYTAVYDKANGTKVSQSVKCNADWGKSKCGGGDYDCMGRCGSGCDNWWAPSAYTLDCLDHDTCSHDMCASGGSDDNHCGDEYDNSADDWVWGVWEGC